MADENFCQVEQKLKQLLYVNDYIKIFIFYNQLQQKVSTFLKLLSRFNGVKLCVIKKSNSKALSNFCRVVEFHDKLCTVCLVIVTK